MASTNSSSMLLTLPPEIRLQIYSYLVLSSPKASRTLCIRTEDPDHFSRNPPLRRTKYLIMGGRLRSMTLRTSYTLTPSTNPGLETSILQVCRQIHSEAAPLLYGNHTFDFGRDVESVVPFLSDLTPTSRRSIRHVKLTKRALPYTRDFDACEWRDVCEYLATECTLEQLGLQVFGGKVPNHQSGAAVHMPGFGNLGNLVGPQPSLAVGTGEGKQVKGFQKEEFALISRFESMEWVRQLLAIKGLRNLDVKPIWEVCPPPCSNALAFFINFSESIEGGFAEFLRENMVAGAA